ncbi:IS1096 element passenger TnpR family protein [Aliikangiella sp. IMCC44359]|uniref:IS1096 element passenger TnpR family protein n=1 Tax=Aliikangiella sp. IMCC44359 TaxID=3459125 RepID=UPI00403AD5BA
MIETLKIKLLGGMYAQQEWECVLEIPIDCSLDELHQAILGAVGFDNDHMYEFCIASSYNSRSAQRISCDDDRVTQETVDTLLSKRKGKKLYYLFDYGDSWLFQINNSRKKRFNEKPDVFYPKVVLENGVRPEQYPEWDE